MSFIYAKNTQCERKELWEKLIHEFNTIMIPWCIIRDFNCVRFMKEKRGGNKLTWINIQELNNFVNATGLAEMSIVGAMFSRRSVLMKKI